MAGYEVRRIRAEEWEQAKQLRLAALQDPVADLAFLETYDEGLARPDEEWQQRIADGAASDRVAQFVAVADVGLVGNVVVLVIPAGERDYAGATADRTRGLVVGVYIRPEHRGNGLLAELVAAAAAWSAGRGIDPLELHVNEGNGRARAAYRKLGFVETGEVAELGTGPELQMVRSGAAE